MSEAALYGMQVSEVLDAILLVSSISVIAFFTIYFAIKKIKKM